MSEYLDKDGLTYFWSKCKDAIKDIIYPVGSVYISFSDTSPATLFGGTWTQIQGKFLLAAGTMGDSTNKVRSVGGASTHYHKYGLTLNIHANSPVIPSGDATSGALNWGNSDMPSGWEHVPITSGTSNINSGITDATTSKALSGTTDGAETTIANTSIGPSLPPYIAVYMWERTA